jgi:hypothetical protein
MEDILVSEQLWKYLGLPEWLTLRSTDRRFHSLLDAETPFKGMASSMTFQGHVTGEGNMRQRVILESFLASPNFQGRSLFCGLTSEIRNIQVALKYAGGYAINLWSDEGNIPEPLPAGLLDLLSLQSYDPGPQPPSHFQVSADFVRDPRTSLLCVPAWDPIYLDIANEQYVLYSLGKFMPFIVKSSYQITGETVTLSTHLLLLPKLTNPHMITNPIWLDREESHEESG